MKTNNINPIILFFLCFALFACEINATIDTVDAHKDKLIVDDDDFSLEDTWLASNDFYCRLDNGDTLKTKEVFISTSYHGDLHLPEASQTDVGSGDEIPTVCPPEAVKPTTNMNIRDILLSSGEIFNTHSGSAIKSVKKDGVVFQLGNTTLFLAKEEGAGTLNLNGTQSLKLSCSAGRKEMISYGPLGERVSCSTRDGQYDVTVNEWNDDVVLYKDELNENTVGEPKLPISPPLPKNMRLVELFHHATGYLKDSQALSALEYEKSVKFITPNFGLVLYKELNTQFGFTGTLSLGNQIRALDCKNVDFKITPPIIGFDEK